MNMYTQEQLEGMSKDELNFTVAGFQQGDSHHWADDEVELDGRIVDYCNNWEDMGPLIEDLSKLGTIVINDGFGLIPEPLAQMICSGGQIPRAAAIVYILVMQERNQ